ncbi:HAD family hydrolase [Streptomyces aureocirculatus]|uniref:HAD family hydrolase n=1 Tax=Streptomyces aureocirculatus TaxID=67275 RepID=UPI000B31CB10|nr:HAD family hydrolase [Streptomyces aureocirculatus]
MDGVGAVVFDFYGTLVRMVRPLPPDHRGIFARRGLMAQGELWGDQWSVGPREGEEHTAYSADEATYTTWERDRLRRRARDCGVPQEALDELVDELDRAMKAISLELFADVREVLAALRHRGLLVGVCSNWFWNLETCVEEVGLGGAVDVVVGSARAGARKPHPLIYRELLDRCALPPGRVLFVGDMWVPDVLGPLDAGMRAVHLYRPDRVVDGSAPPLPTGAARISGLTSLLTGAVVPGV